MAESDTAAPPVAPALPLFYRRIERLSAKRHARLGIVPGARPAFARACNAIPLAVSEFGVAMASYPIAFVGDPIPMPVAVVSLAGSRNVFVDDDGLWAEGAYVPAYVRRYPFLFAQAGEGDKLILCLDPTSSLLAEETDRPLFEQGQSSEALKKILGFCQEFQRQMALTEAFCREIHEAGLFERRAFAARLPDGRAIETEAVQVASMDRLEQLPDEVWLSWRKRGMLSLLYWHIGSLGQVPMLAARHPRG